MGVILRRCSRLVLLPTTHVVAPRQMQLSLLELRHHNAAVAMVTTATTTPLAELTGLTLSVTICVGRSSSARILQGSETGQVPEGELNVPSTISRG
jgi:hypothetical protein